MERNTAPNIKSRKTWAMLAIGGMMMFGLGCEQVWKSDKPVSAENAQELSDIRIPIPNGARNVQFKVSGGTQDWSFYATYEASQEEIKKEIVRQFESAGEDGLKAISQASQLPLSRDEGKIYREFRSAPVWWTPQDIKEGLFVSSEKNGADGPCFWVDTQNSRVFNFVHW